MIFRGTKSRNEKPILTIERSDNELYVYDKYYSGTKIYFEENKITIEKNGYKEYSYILE